MNKNTIIGFILIAVVLIGFSWYNSPSQEQIEAARQQDSIANALQDKAKKAAAQETINKKQQEKALAADTTALFYPALNGKSKQVTLKNNKLELTLDTKGGVVRKARILGFKDLNGAKDLTLFDAKDQIGRAHV